MKRDRDWKLKRGPAISGTPDRPYHSRRQFLRYCGLLGGTALTTSLLIVKSIRQYG